MSANSKIEWTDASWNPVRGCSRVSEGCRNCYAERVAARFSREYRPTVDDRLRSVAGAFGGFAEMTKAGPRWTGKVELIPEILEIPLHWKKPRKIFVNSMSDLFHENLPDEAIDRVWQVMMDSPQHTYQILTKRAERMLNYMTGDTVGGRAHHGTAPDWIWLGVSCEDQPTADKRIVYLLQTPAAVRFVSAEPLLGAINLTSIPRAMEDNEPSREQLHGDMAVQYIRHGAPGLDWVIVGGESGPSARPMHPQWVRDIRDQCQAAGVPFFFKQWGRWRPHAIGETGGPRPREGPDCLHIPDGSWMEPYSKKAAGCLLDGREWNEFPLMRKTDFCA